VEQRAHPAVAGVDAAVDELVGRLTELDGWAAVDALLAVDDLVGRLTAATAMLLAGVDRDGLWATDGARSLTAWFAARQGASYRRAAELVVLARALRDDLPATAQAAVHGQVGIEQAIALARVAPTSAERRAALAAPAEECGEEFLLTQAREQGADAFRRVLRRWAAAADPAADERGYREASERQFLALSPTTGGVHLTGFLTTDHGAALGAALDSVMGAPAPGDVRSTQQRRAGALTDLARLALDHGLTGSSAGVRPHLTCVVDLDTLRRALERTPAGGIQGPTPGAFRLAPVADIERFAVAEVLSAGPIPPSVLARLACDSEITRVVFGPGSQVINVGRAERTFSGPRRRAILARDGTCRYPGCTAPPALGEIHHADHWARDGGQTDVNAGVLLCWYHHHLVHLLGIEVARGPTGGWAFTDRGGRPLAGAA